MALWTDSPIQPDVNYVINLVYTSGPLSLVNYNNFSDPEVDKMIESGASIIDPAARLEHHKGVQQRIQDEAAMGWVVEPSIASACRATCRASTGTRRSSTWYPR